MQKKTLRSLGRLAYIVVVCVLGLFAWVWNYFREMGKHDVWRRDGAPDAIIAKRLSEWNYPASISRVTEIGDKSRATGDGEDLTIYCFALADLPKMKELLGGGEAGWSVGFPAVDGWREHIRDHAPLDLVISQTADPKSYIHIPMLVERMGMDRYWTIIDVVKGVCYQIRFFT